MVAFITQNFQVGIYIHMQQIECYDIAARWVWIYIPSWWFTCQSAEGTCEAVLGIKRVNLKLPWCYNAGPEVQAIGLSIMVSKLCWNNHVSLQWL